MTRRAPIAVVAIATFVSQKLTAANVAPSLSSGVGETFVVTASSTAKIDSSPVRQP